MKIYATYLFLVVTFCAFLSTNGFSKNNLNSNLEASSNYLLAYPATLTNFEYEVNLGPSANQIISVSDGLLLTRPYTVTAPTGFEVSTNPTSGFSNSIVISGALISLGDVDVYVRLSAGLSISTFSGNLTITAPSVTILTILYPDINETISLSGEVKRRVTTWDGAAWDNGDPDIEAITIVDGNYSTATYGGFSAWELSVEATKKLTVADNTYIEVENNVTVDGSVWVETCGSFVQNDNSGSFTVNAGGQGLVKKYTSALNNWYDYTYWSSPVSGTTVNDAFPFSNPSNRFWFNAQNYLDDFAESNNGNTYVAGQDDVDDDGNDWTLLGGSETLIPGVGYATTHSSIGFNSGNSYQYDFFGPFNTGTITTPIYYNGNNGDNDWNFIGNPYPSAISADDFFAANSSVIGSAIYLWSHATPPDGNTNGNETYNYNSDDYAIINAGSGEIAGGTSIIPNRYIPSGQGFFVQGLANGNATFTNAMRMKDNTSNNQFFRESSTEDNKLWVNLTSDNGVFNQVLIAYVDGATNADDGSYYDATRNLSSGASAIIYTTIENETIKKYAIQGKAATSINSEESIALGFYTSISEATMYTFSVAKTQGDFINNNTIILKDNLLNTYHELSASDYTFTSTTGEFNNRFEIVFNAETLSNNETVLNNSLQIIELTKAKMQFEMTNNATIKTIELYDVLGKLVSNKSSNNSTSILNVSNLSKAVYIAKVELEDGIVLTKKFIKHI